MRALIQRVSHASVTVNKEVAGQISQGLLIFLGIGHDDTVEDIEYLVSKIPKLRIFNDEKGKMNYDIAQVEGDYLVISQFTLYANTKKGNRPSYTEAGSPKFAEQMYNEFCEQLSTQTDKKIERGIFGADMKVSLLNNGPVTLLLDSKNP